MDTVLLPPAAVAWIARRQALPVPAEADLGAIRALVEVLTLESAVEMPSREPSLRAET